MTEEDIFAGIDPLAVARIKQIEGDPLLAAMALKDCFWEDDPENFGMKRRSLPTPEIMDRCRALYEAKGGKNGATIRWFGFSFKENGG